MSQRIVVECDRCPLLDREAALATSYLAVKLLDGKARDVDLCDECVKDENWSLHDWQTFLAGEARPIEPARKRTPADGSCPECGREFSSAQGLATHCARVHNRSLAQLRGEPTPFACEHCPRAYATADQLRGHREKASPDTHAA